MRKLQKIFVLAVIIALLLASASFAQEKELNFGTYPMVQDGLQQPAPGKFFIQVPAPLSGVQMQAGDMGWTSGTLPTYTTYKGQRVPVLVEASIEGDMIIGHRAKICGNTLRGAKWPIAGNSMAQQQKQNIIVQVINQAPKAPPPSRAIRMNSRIKGASYGDTQLWLAGEFRNQVATWDEFSQNINNGNFDNSSASASTGGSVGNITNTNSATGGAGGNSSSTSNSSATGGAGGQGGAGGNSSSSSTSTNNNQNNNSNSNTNTNNNNNQNNNSQSQSQSQAQAQGQAQ